MFRSDSVLIHEQGELVRISVDIYLLEGIEEAVVSEPGVFLMQALDLRGNLLVDSIVPA